MRKMYFEDFQEGGVFWGDTVVADRDEMLAYNRQNDPWPFHIDEAAAKQSPFGGIIASGGYTITLMYRSCVGVYNTPERQWQFLGGLDWKLKFAHPVRIGDRLRVKLTVQKKTVSSKRGRGILNNHVEMINQNDEVVMPIDIVALLATRPMNEVRASHSIATGENQ
ncbi:MAG: MaoC/PaaZ C-terminal domain-containing protein [Alphaproteobacteria bacterium]|nr:MaoC/PaaZ C-terminal domain-containing protein [Alphaproteobacteria bacterium]